MPTEKASSPSFAAPASSRRAIVTCSGMSSAAKSVDPLTRRGRGIVVIGGLSFWFGHPLPYHSGKEGWRTALNFYGLPDNLWLRVRPDEASSIQEVQFLRRQGPASQRQSSFAAWEVTSTSKRRQCDRQAATRVK